ncbi:MAG TPA: class I SAM-dependent methyltransferase [Cellulomonas sp.]|uniref:class I SAM-dependent methyltransferase n=1 Tax=Cellulomonas sp. TaxID=40001 RepID=UPI002E2FCC25|nr:class I SAM-dependent methyltransferase [Cellulomonas sp.]HEX5331153.1 class I SAM-dependent methyltransferase [Cellulomonas sp.]
MARRHARLVRYWDDEAARYEETTAPVERRYLADSRRWVGQRAAGSTLELAVGTGLNFPYYPVTVSLTGVDWSPLMVQAAERRARGMPRPIALTTADAMALPFADDQFDTVVCTFALCCIPDERAALTEAIRVLRPGGNLLLADHVVASNLALRALEHLLELVTIPLQGEHYTRRPLNTVRDLGLPIVDTERLTHGAIERVHARKPAAG